MTHEIKTQKPERSPGEYKILSELRNGDKSFTTLKTETGLPGSVLSDYLKRLQRDGLIERDFETRKYRLSGPAIILDLARAISSWPCTFTLTLMPSELEVLREEEEGALIKGRIGILDYAAMLSIHYKGKRDDLVELFRGRWPYWEHRFLTGILTKIREKNVLDEDYFTGKKNFEAVPPEKWNEIFGRLFASSEEVIYVERVRVKYLLEFIKKNADWLNGLVKKDEGIAREFLQKI